MYKPASLTGNTLCQWINYHQSQKKCFNRVIITRVIGLAASVFQLIDATSNVALGTSKAFLALLRSCGVKQFKSDDFSIKIALRYFKMAGVSLAFMPFGSIAAFASPSLFVRCYKTRNKVDMKGPRVSKLSAHERLQSVAKNDLDTMETEKLDNQWNLKEFFGQIFVINIETKGEKRDRFIENASKVGLIEDDFTFHKATYGKTDLSKDVWNRVDNNYCDIDTSTKDGRAALDKQHQAQAGCYMSHYNVIKEAKSVYDEALEKVSDAQNKLEMAEENNEPTDELVKKLDDAKTQLRKKSTVLIMEDDNAFGEVISETPSIHPFNRFGTNASLEGMGKVFREGLLELPSDWEMLYLQSYQMYPNYQDADSEKKICQLKAGLTANAYAVNASAFDKILDRIKKIEEDGTTLYPIDDEYASMHKEGYIKAYGFFPSIAYQNCLGQSSIAKKGDQVNSGQDCWQLTEWGRNVVASAGDGQRLGDQLMNQIKALWVGYQRNIPVVYRPFKYSDQLVLSQNLMPYSEIESKYRKVTNELKDYDPEKPLTPKLIKRTQKLTKALNNDLNNDKYNFATAYNISCFSSDLWLEFDEEDFRNHVQELIKPINPPPLLDLPKDCTTVALHLRKGGDFDSKEVKDSMFTKFPPDEFYIKAIKYIAENQPGKKLYVHVFTDDPNPQALADELQKDIKKLGIKNEIEFNFRSGENSHSSNVLEDFFSITQFDCLVRGDSCFSQAAGILSGPRIEITPPGFNAWEQRRSGDVVVDRFNVYTREEKGKCKHQKTTVNV